MPSSIDLNKFLPFTVQTVGTKSGRQDYRAAFDTASEAIAYVEFKVGRNLDEGVGGALQWNVWDEKRNTRIHVVYPTTVDA